MSEEYSRSVLRVVIAQLCQNLGWQAIQSTPMELLTDILERYLFELGKFSHRYSEQFGRTDPNLDDVGLAFQEMGLNLSELFDYVRHSDPIPFVSEVPKFPTPRPSGLRFPHPNSRELAEREDHIPDHLPPMHPGWEDEILPSSQPSTPAANTSLPFSSPTNEAAGASTSGEKRVNPEDPIDSTPPKIPRLLPDEARPSDYKMRGVTLLDSGGFQGRGILPEAKAPPQTPTTPLSAQPRFPSKPPASMSKLAETGASSGIVSETVETRTNESRAEGIAMAPRLDSGPSPRPTLPPMSPPARPPPTKAALKERPVFPVHKGRGKWKSPGRPKGSKSPMGRSPIRSPGGPRSPGRGGKSPGRGGKSPLKSGRSPGRPPKIKKEPKSVQHIKEEEEVDGGSKEMDIAEQGTKIEETDVPMEVEVQGEKRRDRLDSYDDVIDNVSRDVDTEVDAKIAESSMRKSEEQMIFAQEIEMEKERVAKERKEMKKQAELERERKEKEERAKEKEERRERERVAKELEREKEKERLAKEKEERKQKEKLAKEKEREERKQREIVVQDPLDRLYNPEFLEKFDVNRKEKETPIKQEKEDDIRKEKDVFAFEKDSPEKPPVPKPSSDTPKQKTSEEKEKEKEKKKDKKDKKEKKKKKDKDKDRDRSEKHKDKDRHRDKEKKKDKEKSHDSKKDDKKSAIERLSDIYAMSEKLEDDPLDLSVAKKEEDPASSSITTETIAMTDQSESIAPLRISMGGKSTKITIKGFSGPGSDSSDVGKKEKKKKKNKDKDKDREKDKERKKEKKKDKKEKDKKKEEKKKEKDKDKEKDSSGVPKLTINLGKGGKMSVGGTPKNSPKPEPAPEPKTSIPKLVIRPMMSSPSQVSQSSRSSRANSPAPPPTPSPGRSPRPRHRPSQDTLPSSLPSTPSPTKRSSVSPQKHRSHSPASDHMFESSNSEGSRSPINIPDIPKTPSPNTSPPHSRPLTPCLSSPRHRSPSRSPSRSLSPPPPSKSRISTPSPSSRRRYSQSSSQASSPPFSPRSSSPSPPRRSPSPGPPPPSSAELGGTRPSPGRGRGQRGRPRGRGRGGSPGRGGGPSPSLSSSPEMLPPPPPSSAALSSPSKGPGRPKKAPQIVVETQGKIIGENGETIWICPACKMQDDGSPMIGCDTCDDWYHWVCVGITSEPPEDQQWYCPRCQATRDMMGVSRDSALKKGRGRGRGRGRGKKKLI